jgi:hypothetical protein
MERIGEGATAISLGELVAAAHAVTIATLVVLALVSLFTGFRMALLPFRPCPFIFGLSGVLIAVGAWV